jgi:hypothetical protein
LEKIPIHLQADIGFGDPVTPPAREAEYPVLLDFPAPLLWIYPCETVVAEKFQALVFLGLTNTRMKDFYDLWVLACQFDFHGSTLAGAIMATFAARRTPLPSRVPPALAPPFFEDRAKITQWAAFCKRVAIREVPGSFPELGEILRAFLVPPAQASQQVARRVAPALARVRVVSGTEAAKLPVPAL